jgi:hypothetical protein
MSLFKKSRKGWDCRDESDGTTRCRRIEQVDENRLGTGTDIGIGVDPETCQPIFKGDVSIMDDDEGDIDRIVQRKVGACRRSKGL